MDNDLQSLVGMRIQSPSLYSLAFFLALLKIYLFLYYFLFGRIKANHGSSRRLPRRVVLVVYCCSCLVIHFYVFVAKSCISAVFNSALFVSAKSRSPAKTYLLFVSRFGRIEVACRAASRSLALQPRRQAASGLC